MPEVQWIEADMTKLRDSFAPESFDVVIDKAAMDALMCDEGSVWSPSVAVIEQAAAMCHGITSVLVPQGTFLQISFAQPHFRKRFLLGEGEQAPSSTVYGWDYSYHNIGACLHCLQRQVPGSNGFASCQQISAWATSSTCCRRPRPRPRAAVNIKDYSLLSTLFLTWWTPSRAWWRFPRSNRAGSELMHGCLLTCFFNCNRSPVFTGASGVRVHDVDHVDKRPYDGHSDGRRGQLRGARLGQLHELDEVGVSDGVVAGRGQQLLFLAEG
jgi:hypothetical protein